MSKNNNEKKPANKTRRILEVVSGFVLGLVGAMCMRGILRPLLLSQSLAVVITVFAVWRIYKKFPDMAYTFAVATGIILASFIPLPLA